MMVEAANLQPERDALVQVLFDPLKLPLAHSIFRDVGEGRSNPVLVVDVAPDFQSLPVQRQAAGGVA